MAEANPLVPPRAVAWLGYGGLLPFVLLAAASLLDPHHGALWRNALHAYAAIILGFVGAVHWGLAMSLPGLTDGQRSTWFGWSVVPALIAWLALLVSAAFAAPLLIAGFIAHYVQDRRLALQAALPGWYLPLRLRLSGVAVVCLLAGVIAAAGIFVPGV